MMNLFTELNSKDLVIIRYCEGFSETTTVECAVRRANSVIAREIESVITVADRFPCIQTLDDNKRVIGYAEHLPF